MSFFEKIQKIFEILFKKPVSETKPEYEREMRELLRENLNTVAVDVFHSDDPIIFLNPAQRREYLLYFNKLVVEKKLIERFKYLINKQAQMTLLNSRSGQLDTAGVMKMDGMGTLKDDVERLSSMFITEEAARIPRPLTPTDSLKL